MIPQNITSMASLNLPPAALKLFIIDGKQAVFDVLRNKMILLTPEEWVRQHFVHFLISDKKYPQSLMGNEILLTLNGMKKRCDTVVYKKDLTPLVIIEYKAPHIKITQEVFNQICRYNFVLKVNYLIVSNGINHYCCKMNYENKTYTFLKEIPLYSELD